MQPYMSTYLMTYNKRFVASEAIDKLAVLIKGGKRRMMQQP